VPSISLPPLRIFIASLPGAAFGDLSRGMLEETPGRRDMPVRRDHRESL
jgi:hypothetical protein